jgi:TRAP-type C4-dicarboxylate transport system permease large subunit
MISCAVAKVPLSYAIKDTMIMLIPMLVVLLAIIVFPDIVLFLPTIFAPDMIK